MVAARSVQLKFPLNHRGILNIIEFKKQHTHTRIQTYTHTHKPTLYIYSHVL